MSSAQDPFYIVKEEIQDSIDKLLSTFHRWEALPSEGVERTELTKQLRASSDSIEWQVDELDKAVGVAARDPAYYGLDAVELERRRRWTKMARDQVGTVKKSVSAGKELKGQEMVRIPIDNAYYDGRSNQYSQDNDDLISSESDRQMLLMRQQDEELDELSASVLRIGDVGRTIHDELLGQERIIDEFGNEMESTTNRLDFLQKKVAFVMKKAGAKGQFMMILFLVLLFIVLFVLVFFT